MRSTDQVTASRDNRELTPVALYVPILCILILFGLWNSYKKERRLAKEAEAEIPSEETGLLSAKSRENRRSSVVSIQQAFSRQSEVNKRISGQVMGLTAYDTQEEKTLSEQMHHDMEEWEKLAEEMEGDP